MLRLAYRIMVLTSCMIFLGCQSSTDPASWSNEKIDKWFEKGEWLNGWTVKPDASVNRKEFALAYFRNKERWDKAFTYLKENDLAKIEAKRYDIDNNNLYATVSEYITKNEEDAKFEAHRQYIDIQYVINGAEIMGIAPVEEKKEALVPYDQAKDLEFFTVNKYTDHRATPDRFFIFFPSDIHRPSLKDGQNLPVRKVVVKVKTD